MLTHGVGMVRGRAKGAVLLDRNVSGGVLVRTAGPASSCRNAAKSRNNDAVRPYLNHLVHLAVC